MDMDKVQQILDWPETTLVKAVQSSLCHTTTINDLSFKDILHHHLSTQAFSTCFS